MFHDKEPKKRLHAKAQLRQAQQIHTSHKKHLNQGTHRWTIGQLADGYVGTPEFYALEDEAEGTREISLKSEKVWIATETGPNRIALYEWSNERGKTLVRLKGATVPAGYKQKEFLGYVWKK